MYNKIILSIIIFFLFFFNIAFSNESWCSVKKWDERYKCQINNICKEYKPKEITYKTEKFDSKDSDFENAKKIYIENQNGIYSCAIIKLQYNTLFIIKDKLSKIDKTWTLKSKIDKKIKLKIDKLKNLYKKRKCVFPLEKWSNKDSIYFKKILLKESSYEFCKYSFYLEFLDKQSKEIDKKDTTTAQLAKSYKEKQDWLSNEMKHSWEVFNMVFSTYIDYENNYPVHLLLELIKEDFIVLREKLNEALSPITQVSSKISNAMSIN